MIRTKNLTKKYGQFTAVNSIDLNIERGEIYGFLGPNGAGKTSTIMMLLGISEPSGGEIFLFGERFSPRRFDLKKKIGVVPEKHPSGVWKWMTAYEYLQFFADQFGVENSDERIKRLLGRVRLEEAGNKRFHTFSRGMLQKLSIVRALLHEPDILFFDEPISGLDPIGIKQVRDLIEEENKAGRTIFISSHLLSEIEKVCGRVGIISRGRLVAEDRMSSLLSTLNRNREIIVEIENIPRDLTEALRSLKFVLDAEIHQNILHISVEKEGDHRKALSEFLFKRQLIPLRIDEKSISLEDAFVTITSENVDMIASIGGNT